VIGALYVRICINSDSPSIPTFLQLEAEPSTLKIADQWVAACQKHDYVDVMLYDTDEEDECIRLRTLRDLQTLIAMFARATDAGLGLTTEFASPLSKATYTAIMTRLVPSFHDVNFKPVPGFAYPPIPKGPLAMSRVENVSYGRPSDPAPSGLEAFAARLKDARA